MKDFMPNALDILMYRVFIKYCVFSPRILESLPPLPRQLSAAIGCTKNYQQLGVTVNSHCVAVNCEKHNFYEHPVLY